MTLIAEFEGVSAEQPWPGLMPFTEDAQAFFHGRDAEAVELLRLIKRETLTVLFGQSGLGKSSLLNAGLFPKLRQEDFLPVYIRLEVSPTAPALSAQTRTIVAAELARHGVDARAPRDNETLWEYFHATDVDFWSARNRLLTPVLVFDQFEEIFTLGRHDEGLRNRCRAFLEELGDLVEGRTPESVARRLDDNPDLAAKLDFGKRNCKILLSFREDFLPDFEGLRGQIRSIMQNRMRLTRMNGVQALEAVTLSGGHLVAPGVAERIIQFVAGPRAIAAGDAGADYSRLEIEPALLSLVCRELNSKRIAARRIQITADLLEAGAQQEIIADFYQRSLADLDPEVRIFVEDQLLTEAGYRDSYALEDALHLPGVAQEAIDTLVARRLLRLEERFGVLRVELTHDVLTRVVKESRDRRQAREAEARRREQELVRRRRTRRLVAIGVGSGVGLLSLVVVLAILMQRAVEEKNRVVETQSNVLVTQANISLENRTPRDPHAYLAKAIRLNPHNDAATARIVTLFSQRRYPLHLDDRPVAEELMRAGAGWLDDNHIRLGNQIVSADDLYRAWYLRAIGRESYASDTQLTQRRVSGLSMDLPQNTTPRSLPLRHDARSSTYIATSLETIQGIFDAQSLKPLGQPPARDTQAVPAAVSRDRRLVAAYSADHRIEVWPLAVANAEPMRIDLPEAKRRIVTGIELAPDGSGALVWFGDGTASLYDTAAGKAIWTQKMARGTVQSDGGSLSPGGHWIATIQLNMVQLHDARTGAAHGKPLQHSAPINFVSFSQSDEHLVTASQDQTARIWHAGSASLAAPALNHDGPVLTARFSGNNLFVITGSLDGTARIWSTAGELMVEPQLHEAPVIAADISGNGQRVFTISSDGRLSVWKPNFRDSERAGFAPDLPVTTLAASGDGKRIAAATARGEIVIWRMTGENGAGGHAPTQEARFEAHATSILALSFSQGGSLLATAARDGTVRVWDVATGKPLGKPMAHRGAVRAVRFGAGDASLLTISEDRTARVWSIEASLQRGLPMRHGAPVIDAQMTRDGKRIITAADTEVRIWDAPTGALLSQLQHGDPVHSISVSPDGTEVLAASGHAVVMWKLPPGNIRQSARAKPDSSIPARTLVWTVRHSRDGKRFAAGGLDGTVQVWERDGLSPVSAPMRHSALVTSLDFSGDDRWLVTRTRDHVVRVWDARSGQMVADPLRHDYDVSGVVGAPDLDWIATAAGNVRLFRLGLGYRGTPPEWFAPLVETVGGARVDDSGALVLIERRTKRLTELMNKLQPARADGYWGAKSRELLDTVMSSKDPASQPRKKEGS
jgi:WD40 repeat protein